MPRLFTAIEIPETMRMRLSLLRAPIGGAKWVQPEDMHITLRFAGDIDGRMADDLASLLADVRIRPFSLSIAGKWTDYHVSFQWMSEIEALHLACAFDVKVPEARQGEVLKPPRTSRRMVFWLTEGC